MAVSVVEVSVVVAALVLVVSAEAAVVVRVFGVWEVEVEVVEV